MKAMIDTVPAAEDQRQNHLLPALSALYRASWHGRHRAKDAQERFAKAATMAWIGICPKNPLQISFEGPNCIRASRVLLCEGDQRFERFTDADGVDGSFPNPLNSLPVGAWSMVVPGRDKISTAT